ncbi:unnamed protein product [Rotaria sp. Silwood1]|nr:unnamed protein product [Rotaria sp. Silwood1]
MGVIEIDNRIILQQNQNFNRLKSMLPINLNRLNYIFNRLRLIAVLNYFGSFPFWLYAEIPSDQEPTLASLAQLIHEMYSKQTEHSLREYNAYLMSGDGDINKNRADADIINRDFYCSSWRKGNIYGANFGNSGFPIYSGPTDHLYPRYFAMMDSYASDGSVNIILGLREQDYERMIQQNMLRKYR